MQIQGERVSIKRYTWRYLSLILLVALSGVTIATAIAIHSIQRDGERQELFELNLFSKDIGNLVGFYDGLSSTLAKRQEVIDLLTFSDRESAVLWAKETRKLIPNAIGVALIDTDGNILGEPLQLNLGKRCISDLRRLLAGETLFQPPVHRETVGLHHFDIVKPVRSNGELLGLLFTSFSLDVIQQRAGQLIDEGQHLFIEDATDTSVAEIGGAYIFHEQILQKATLIPGTDWHIHYAREELETNRLFVTAVVVGIAIFITTITLTLLLSGRLAGLFRRDLNHIRALLDGVAIDQPGKSEHVTPRLAETSTIMDDVSSMIAELEKSHQKLDWLSHYDELTGLMNRRGFDKALKQHQELSGRGLTVRLVLLDLDHFKQVNDRYGHGLGDQVLQALAASLRDRCRSTDTIARLGGDEFAVIMPGDGEESLEGWYIDVDALFIERQARLNDGNGIEQPCRISAGAIEFEKGGVRPPEELVEQADLLLYEAKHDGRARLREKRCG